MNFIEYCELPDNQVWINDFLWAMKAETGFDADAVIDAVCEQATDENVTLTDDVEDDYATYFAAWYDELDYSEGCGAV